MIASTSSPASAGPSLQGGNVVSFAAASRRRFRREASASDGPLGQILLYTGVRYERMPAEADLAPQRKRS